MTLKLTEKQAAQLGLGKRKRKGKRTKDRMDPQAFKRALEFRAESAKRRPDGRPCWHPLVEAGGGFACTEGC